MRKNLTTILTVIISVFAIATIVYAANTFPATLNEWDDGDIIESDWADALEAKIGVTGSTVTSALDYQMSHLASLSRADTISGNWVNTANPWADNEVADDITASNYYLASNPSNYIALTNLSASSPITYNNGTGAFSITSGFTVPPTASVSAWEGFYDTPSNRITDGTGLTWSTNTLNVDDIYLLNTSDTFTGNLDIQGNASVSGNLELVAGSQFSGAGLVDCDTAATSKLLWDATSAYFSCGTDATGAITKAFGWIDANNSGGTFVSIGSLSFDTGHFTFSNTASEGYLRLDWNSVASLSTAETIAGNWVNTTNPWADDEVVDALTVTGGVIGANSISGTQTTTGTLTIGDNGDSIIIDASNWDINTLGKADFLSASVSTNFEVLGYVSASQYFGAGVNTAGSCDDDTDKLEYDSVTGLFTCATLADADIPDTLSMTGTWTTTGNLTIGDGGDDVIINSDTWDVSSTGAMTGLTGIVSTGLASFVNASTSGNFESTGFVSAATYIGAGVTGAGDCNDATDKLLYDSTTGLFTCGTLADADMPANVIMAGEIDAYSELNAIVADVTLTHNGLIDTFAELDAIVADKALVNKADGAVWLGVHDFGGATSFEIPNGTLTIDGAGEIGVKTASASSGHALRVHDGTAERVYSAKICFGLNYPAPTSKDHLTIWNAYDPFTINEVFMIASGSNAMGWQLRHGLTVATLTDLFSTIKSASGSIQILYTTFADATLTDGERIGFVITSESATIDSIFVRVCGYYNP